MKKTITILFLFLFIVSPTKSNYGKILGGNNDSPMRIIYKSTLDNLDTEVLTETFSQAGELTFPIVGMVPDVSRAGNAWQDSAGQWWQNGTLEVPNFCLATTANNSETMYIDLGMLNYPVTYVFEIWSLYYIDASCYQGMKFRMENATAYYYAGVLVEYRFSAGDQYRVSVGVFDQDNMTIVSAVIGEWAPGEPDWAEGRFYIFRLVDTSARLKLYTTANAADDQTQANCTTLRIDHNNNTNNNKYKCGFYTNFYVTDPLYKPRFDSLTIVDAGQ